MKTFCFFTAKTDLESYLVVNQLQLVQYNKVKKCTEKREKDRERNKKKLLKNRKLLEVNLI